MKCNAPVFERNNLFVCIFLTIIFTLAIVAVLVATLFLCVLFPQCRCIIKQYQYRIRNCTRGNSNPNLPI